MIQHFYRYIPATIQPEHALGTSINPLYETEADAQKGVLIPRKGAKRPINFEPSVYEQLIDIGYDTLVELTYLDKGYKKAFKKLNVVLPKSINEAQESTYQVRVNGKIVEDIESLIRRMEVMSNEDAHALLYEFMTYVGDRHDSFKELRHLIETIKSAWMTHVITKSMANARHETYQNPDSLLKGKSIDIMSHIMSSEMMFEMMRYVQEWIIEYPLKVVLDEMIPFLQQYFSDILMLRALGMLLFVASRPISEAVFKIYDRETGESFMHSIYENVHLMIDKRTLVELETQLKLISNESPVHYANGNVEFHKNVQHFYMKYQEFQQAMSDYGVYYHQLHGVELTLEMFDSAQKTYTKTQSLQAFHTRLLIECLGSINCSHVIVTPNERNHEHLKSQPVVTDSQVQERIKALEKQLKPYEALKVKYQILQDDHDALQEAFADTNNQLESLRLSQSKNDQYNEDAWIDELNHETTFYIGGDINLMRRVKQLLPNIHVLDTDELGISYDALKYAKYIIFNTSMTNHGCYYKVKAHKPANIPISYINRQYADPRRVIYDVYLSNNAERNNDQ